MDSLSYSIIALHLGIYFVGRTLGEVETMEGRSGNFSSPRWPLPYPPLSANRWIITAPVGMNVLLEMGRNFSLEFAWLSPGCYDFLNVIDPKNDIASVPPVCGSGSSVKHTFCGSSSPDPVTSCSNQLIVDFCSDSTVHLGGFSARWEAIDAKDESTPSPLSPFPSQCGTPAVAPDIAFFPNGSIDSIQPLMRIVGGNPASKHSWPWAVNFWEWIPLLSRWNNFCGGSLLNNEWVLTAAHCFYQRSDVRNYRVKLGAFDKGDSPLANEQTQMACGIRKVIIHSQYDHQKTSSDIALVKLDCQVSFTPSIQPICIPDSFDISNEERVVVVGWGATSTGGMQSQTLQEVIVDAVDFAQCNLDYEGLLDTGMFCAAAPGKDSCQGDSGGPLMSHRDGVWFQSGIVSWGYGCADSYHPGIYTRVGNFKTWIASTINADVIPRACLT